MPAFIQGRQGLHPIRRLAVFEPYSKEVLDFLLRHPSSQLLRACQQVNPFGKHIRLQRRPAKEYGDPEKENPNPEEGHLYQGTFARRCGT